MNNLHPIKPERHHNYVAFFLTMNCNLHCSYCINLHGDGSRLRRTSRYHMDIDDWIRAADRLELRKDLPLTLQGGEPTLYKGFYRFVNEVKEDIKIDLLTNMTFDVDEFIRQVPLWRFQREAPYASIRVSYHPGQNMIEDLIRKTFRLQEAGFRIGIYGILYPDKELRKYILEAEEKCRALGIDFRTKEFLGIWKGRLYGTYRYEGAVSGDTRYRCRCRTTEIIVDPAGYIYRCHSDLYSGRNPISHILDDDFTEEEINRFRDCHNYGNCNPCDVKVKTNRFQQFGHTSVEIRDIVKVDDEEGVLAS
jgi:hypothetical protein